MKTLTTKYTKLFLNDLLKSHLDKDNTDWQVYFDMHSNAIVIEECVYIDIELVCKHCMQKSPCSCANPSPTPIKV